MNATITTRLRLVEKELEVLHFRAQAAITEAQKLTAKGFAVAPEVVLKQMAAALMLRRQGLGAALTENDPHGVLRALSLLLDDIRHIDELDLGWSVALESGRCFADIRKEAANLLFGQGGSPSRLLDDLAKP